jgi:uncharacterized membrane-anchored protein YhcB (DUF1043 family)
MNITSITVSILVLLIVLALLIIFVLFFRFLGSQRRKEAKLKRELKRNVAQVRQRQQELDGLSARLQKRLDKKGS